MLSMEDVKVRFGRMPEDAVDARGMVKILISEMQTDQIVSLVAKIKATKNKTPAFLFGLQAAEKELTTR